MTILFLRALIIFVQKTFSKVWVLVGLGCLSLPLREPSNNGMCSVWPGVLQPKSHKVRALVSLVARLSAHTSGETLATRVVVPGAHGPKDTNK